MSNRNQSTDPVVGLIFLGVAGIVGLIYLFSESIGVDFNTGSRVLVGSIIATVVAGIVVFMLGRPLTAVSLWLLGIWTTWHPVIVAKAMPFRGSMWGGSYGYGHSLPWYASSWLWWVVVLVLLVAIVVLFVTEDW